MKKKTEKPRERVTVQVKPIPAVTVTVRAQVPPDVARVLGKLGRLRDALGIVVGRERPGFLGRFRDDFARLAMRGGD